MPICFRLFTHWIRRAASRADWTAGRSKAINRPMIAITTSNSISVNPPPTTVAFRGLMRCSPFHRDLESTDTRRMIPDASPSLRLARGDRRAQHLRLPRKAMGERIRREGQIEEQALEIGAGAQGAGIPRIGKSLQ